jgi:hypothetical protein
MLRPEIRGLTLLVRVLQGPGGRRAILPRLRAQVVVEARTSGHRLGVEVSREGAVLLEAKPVLSKCKRDPSAPRIDVLLRGTTSNCFETIKVVKSKT